MGRQPTSWPSFPKLHENEEILVRRAPFALLLDPPLKLFVTEKSKTIVIVITKWKCVLFSICGNVYFLIEYFRASGNISMVAEHGDKLVHDSSGSRFPQSYFWLHLFQKKKILWIFCGGNLDWLLSFPRNYSPNMHHNFMSTEGWVKFIYSIDKCPKELSVCLMCHNICLFTCWFWGENVSTVLHWAPISCLLPPWEIPITWSLIS